MSLHEKLWDSYKYITLFLPSGPTPEHAAATLRVVRCMRLLGFMKETNLAIKDRIGDELAWLRITYALAIAADISLIGWMATSYSETAVVLIILAAAASFAL
jgi:hypothetical protein